MCVLSVCALSVLCVCVCVFMWMCVYLRLCFDLRVRTCVCVCQLLQCKDGVFITLVLGLLEYDPK